MRPKLALCPVSGMRACDVCRMLRRTVRLMPCGHSAGWAWPELLSQPALRLQGVLLLLRAPLESPSRAYLQRAARRLRALVSVGLVTPQPDIATDARQLTPRNPAVGEAPVTLHQTSASELLAALTGPQADSMEGESPLMRPDGRAPRVRMRAPCSLPSLQRKPARRRVGAASGPAVGAAAASRRGLLSGDDRCCRTTPDIDAVFAET